MVFFEEDPWYDIQTGPEFKWYEVPFQAQRYRYGRKIYFVYPEEYNLLVKVEQLRSRDAIVYISKKSVI